MNFTLAYLRFQNLHFWKVKFFLVIPKPIKNQNGKFYSVLYCSNHNLASYSLVNSLAGKSGVFIIFRLIKMVARNLVNEFFTINAPAVIPLVPSPSAIYSLAL